MTETSLLLVHASYSYPSDDGIKLIITRTRKFWGLNEECVSEHLSPEDFKQNFCLPPNGSTYPLSSTCAADVHFSFPITKDISLCAKYPWVIDHFKQALQPSLICVLSAGYCCPGLCYYSNWEQVFLRPGSLHTPHFRKLSIKSNLVMAHKGSITCPHQLIFLR